MTNDVHSGERAVPLFIANKMISNTQLYDLYFDNLDNV